jgi:hypothetical protein
VAPRWPRTIEDELAVAVRLEVEGRCAHQPPVVAYQHETGRPTGPVPPLPGRRECVEEHVLDEGIILTGQRVPEAVTASRLSATLALRPTFVLSGGDDERKAVVRDVEVVGGAEAGLLAETAHLLDAIGATLSRVEQHDQVEKG